MIPGGRSEIPHATQHTKKKKEKRISKGRGNLHNILSYGGGAMLLSRDKFG